MIVNQKLKLTNMKKIIILSLAVAAFGFVSCKKCKSCTTHTTVKESGSPDITTSTSVDYCGKDYDEAPEANVSVASTAPGDTIVVEVACNEK